MGPLSPCAHVANARVVEVFGELRVLRRAAGRAVRAVEQPGELVDVAAEASMRGHKVGAAFEHNILVIQK